MRGNNRLLELALTLLAILSSGDSVLSQEPGRLNERECVACSAELVLVETSVFRHPDSFRMRGATAASGKFVFWGEGEPQVLVLGAGEETPMASVAGFDDVLAAAMHPSDTLIMVVDVDAWVVITVAFDGQAVDVWPLDMIRDSLRPHSAVWIEPHWYIAGADAGGNVRVYRIGKNGDALRVFTLAAAHGSTGEPSSVHMSADRKQLLLSTLGEPFTTIAVDTLGRELWRSSLQPRLANDGKNGDQELWVALKTVSLGDVYVQTVADMRSDQRILVLFDTSGAVFRQKAIDAPFGVMLADPPSRTLLAARWVGQLEVVAYEWTWRQGGDTAVPPRPKGGSNAEDVQGNGSVGGSDLYVGCAEIGVCTDVLLVHRQCLHFELPGQVWMRRTPRSREPLVPAHRRRDLLLLANRSDAERCRAGRHVATILGGPHDPAW